MNILFFTLENSQVSSHMSSTLFYPYNGKQSTKYSREIRFLREKEILSTDAKQL